MMFLFDVTQMTGSWKIVSHMRHSSFVDRESATLFLQEVDEDKLALYFSFYA